MTTAAPNVRRARTERRCHQARIRSPTVRAEPVAATAHGLDGFPSERYVDLPAQVSDVDLDDVGVAVVELVPHMLDQLGLADDPVGAAHQVLEDSELPARQSHRGAVARAPP